MWNHNLGVVGRGWGVGRSSLVGRGRGVTGSSRSISGLGSISPLSGVLGLSLVPDIGDISGVGIGNGVGDNLGATVGKVDTVLSVGGVAITGLVLGKVHLGVVISDGVSVLVHSRGIIAGLGLVGSRLVSRCWGICTRGISRGRVGGRSVGEGDGGKSKNNEDL